MMLEEEEEEEKAEEEMDRGPPPEVHPPNVDEWRALLPTDVRTDQCTDQRQRICVRAVRSTRVKKSGRGTN